MLAFHISKFSATQCPVISRFLKNERSRAVHTSAVLYIDMVLFCIKRLLIDRANFSASKSRRYDLLLASDGIVLRVEPDGRVDPHR